MMNRFVGAFLVIVVFVLFLAQSANACSCLAVDVGRAYSFSEVIFIGKVLKQESLERNSLYSRKYTFNIIKCYKGNVSNEISIYTGHGNCSANFDTGLTYLIYASKYKGNKLSTSTCGRISVLGSKGKKYKYHYKYYHDLRYLEKMLTNQIVTYSYGHVEIVNSNKIKSPLASKRITLYNREKKYESFTDSIGNYVFENLPIDTYKVNIDAPQTHAIQFDFEIDLTKDSCDEQDFDIVPNGRISGTVMDKFGKPLGHVTVNAMSFDQDNREHDFLYYSEPSTYENGSYHIKLLPPGLYYVGVNINNSPSGWDPFPPTYYPSSHTLTSANVLKVSLGEAIENINIRIDSVLTTKTIVGDVKFSNGMYAIDGGVSIFSDSTCNNLIHWSPIDSAGTFKLIILESVVTESWILPAPFVDDRIKAFGLGKTKPYHFNLAHREDSIHFVLQFIHSDCTSSQSKIDLVKIKKFIILSVFLFSFFAILAKLFKMNSKFNS